MASTAPRKRTYANLAALIFKEKGTGINQDGCSASIASSFLSALLIGLSCSIAAPMKRRLVSVVKNFIHEAEIRKGALLEVVVVLCVPTGRVKL